MSEPLKDSDIDRIAAALAPRLIEGVRERHHDFWIDPETHYQDHLTWRTLKPEDVATLRDLIKLFVVTRGLFWKAFLGFAIVGTLVTVAVGMGFNR